MKFYQPPETKGIFNPKENRLTVNWNDHVLVGVRSVSKKEEDEVYVSCSDESKILARYRAAPLKVELLLDTSRPDTYTLEATKEGGFLDPAKSVVEPLEIHVRFDGYRSYPAQGQWNDATGCWAACLVWWLDMLPARPYGNYNEMLMMFSKMWNRDGTINIPGFRAGVQRNDGLFRMHTSTINPSTLKSFMGNWPLIIGFKHPGGFGHMNVLYEYNRETGKVRAMEPWSPDTDDITWADDGPYLNNPDFTFTGAHVERPLSHYMEPAPGMGNLLIGYPREYDSRIPG